MFASSSSSATKKLAPAQAKAAEASPALGAPLLDPLGALGASPSATQAQKQPPQTKAKEVPGDPLSDPLGAALLS